LALTSPTSGSRSVGTIRSRTKATDLVFLVHGWFAETVGMSGAFALYLREGRNFVWLFERMLLLVEFVGYIRFVRKEFVVSTGEVGMFYFVGLCRPYIPCNPQDDFHDRGHIGHN
jgi:hypothetical protein